MKKPSRLTISNYRKFMAQKAREDASGLGNAFGPRAGFRYPDKALRAKILERDGYRCRYCRVLVTDKTANMDHVVAWPWGLTVELNLVTACRPCNQAKGRSYVIPVALKGSPYYRLRRRRRRVPRSEPSVSGSVGVDT